MCPVAAPVELDRRIRDAAAAIRADLAQRRIDRRAALIAGIGAGLSLATLRTFAVSDDAAGAARLPTPEPVPTTTDLAIVGAGSAGCVVAHRLSADPDLRVLLIEAGNAASLPQIDVPSDWPGLSGSAVDWRYATTAQAGLGGRVVPYPRGKVLGGSSAINGLAYQRGHRSGYDRWLAAGSAGWGYDDLLPFFKRAETFSGGADAWHGGAGPLHVLALQHAPHRHPVAAAFIAAAGSGGFAFNRDIGGARATGAAWNQLSIHGARRDSAASAYLEPVAGRKNLTVLTGAQVLRLTFAGARCTGFVVQHGDRVHTVRVEREVVLAAGAIDSPKLLQLSGVGPAERLRALGIPVVADLPGVGANLQDHVLGAGVAYEARRTLPRSHYNHGEGLLYVPHAPGPEVLIMSVTLPFVLPSVGPAPQPAYVLTPCLMRPRSRGHVRLASIDPRDAPLIDPAFLSADDDVETLADGFALARELGAAREMADWRRREVYPGPGIGRDGRGADRPALRAFARRAANSFHHPVGTCRMGRDADTGAVVDLALRVRGVDGLRVIDASVMPSIPQAMVNAATIAVAERGSALLRGER